MSDRAAWTEQLDKAESALIVVIQSAQWMPEIGRSHVIWAIRLAVSAVKGHGDGHEQKG